jgi:hypothetical protein
MQPQDVESLVTDAEHSVLDQSRQAAEDAQMGKLHRRSKVHMECTYYQL